ncbi:S1/P1 nuclease [Hymenobacter humi]|uniref:S1/P1 nuclease n=1 Tax=Hymenobacter humi TaxID=1411620 RepID=A0ABW2UDB6_9BACT
MRSKISLLLALVLLPYSLLAWGVLGHRAIGRIAENHLTPHAKREMQRLLGTETLTLVTTWPDEIRPDPQYAPLAVWHYVNVAPNLPLAAYAGRSRPAPRRPATPTRPWSNRLRT